MKKGLVIVLSALVLASCGRPQRTVSPKSSDTKQTSTSEKKQSGMDLKAIKAKDYSSIKGTWIDGRGNELVFDDKGLVSEDVELDASNFKQKDQIAEMTVSAKSGVGGYGLLLLPKGQKAGKDDASDKSKLRISPRIGSGLVSHRLMAMMTISTIARKSNRKIGSKLIQMIAVVRLKRVRPKSGILDRIARSSLRRRRIRMIIQATPLLRSKLRVSGLM
ncbi:DUF6287 domain-containing protein [Streptococcus parasanguinis]|uniref:DUF6287 domain-containing protein n=1 Tax=Streptococcus parasanguinis TaxID=1318 RepID=UPI0039C055ED